MSAAASTPILRRLSTRWWLLVVTVLTAAVFVAVPTVTRAAPAEPTVDASFAGQAYRTTQN